MMVATQASAQTFSVTGSMSIRRDSATATQLLNGKVLVAGGSDGTTSRGTAELYDPVAGSFSATGSMIRARRDHTATLLQNGKVLVTGGLDNDGNLTATAEIYDPSSGAFTTTGNLIVGCQDHAATLLADGRVLITGCTDASAQLYDPNTGTFTATGSMHDARGFHTATLLANGKVLVAGGNLGGGIGDETAELYDPSSGTFSATGSMATGRYAHTATLLPDGRVLVAGGESSGVPTASAEIYDPAGGSFKAVGNMTVGRAYFTATLLPNGQVLTAGGLVLDPNHGPQPSIAADLFNPSNGTFAATASMTTARSFQVASLLSNGTVLVAGGGVQSAELYHPASMPVVKLMTPIGGAVVQKTVNIFTTASPQAEWISVYIGGQYLGSSPPFNFSWDTRTVINGLRSITVRAFAGNARIGIDTIQVDVENGTGPVSITSPSNSATVSGSVPIATRKDASVAWENVYLDGSYFASSPPTTFTWDSSKVANGSHAVSAVGFSASGAQAGSDAITVDVENVTKINSPQNRTTVTGTVGISTTMASSVQWENMYIDGQYLASSPPTSFQWNSRSVPNGSHTISATAYGTGNSQIGSASITVTVAN